VKSPLSDYKKIDVQAGYASAPLVAFYGTVLVAYQELPGPDGVTMFQLLLGNLDTWRSVMFGGIYSAGQFLSTVCQDFADRMSVPSFKINLVYNIVPDVPLKADLQYTGFAKDIIHLLKQVFSDYDSNTHEAIGIEFSLIGDTLYVYYADQGMPDQNITRLDFITHAKHNSAGFEIIAPWIPSLRPGHLIWIDPKYFRQDFGGSQVAIGNQYRLYMIDFDFCTTDATNTMTLLTVGAQ
jgi:hypothetical protein